MNIEIGSVLTIEQGPYGAIINLLVEEIDMNGTIYAIDSDGAEYEMSYNARGKILDVQAPI